MTRRFLKQLLPIGILAGVWFGLGLRAGVSPFNANAFFLWSCNLSRGVFVASNGGVALSPEVKPDTPALGRQIVDTAHGCAN